MQSIQIRNKDGLKLAAYLFLPEHEPRFFLLVCHGFRGAKENGGRIYPFAEQVKEIGGGVLAFDFSGSGKSEGEFLYMTLRRQADDLGSVMDYIKVRYNVPLVLLGRSFGGSTVLAAGADEQVMACILWSTPVFLSETFTAMLPDAYKNLSAGQIVHIHDDAGDYELDAGFLQDLLTQDMDQYLAALGDKKVLLIHARDDEVVPVENAEYIKQKLKQAKLHIIDDAGHRFLQQKERREKLTLEWLEKIIEEQDTFC